MVKELYSVTNTSTLEDEKGVYHNSKCAVLSEKGREQAVSLAKLLEKEKIDLVLSGKLVRQSQTAEIIANYLNLNVVFSPALIERAGGDLEGKTHKDTHLTLRSYLELYGKGKKSPLYGMESLNLVFNRIENFSSKLFSYCTDYFPEQKILIVGSRFITSYLINYLMDEKPIYHEQDPVAVHYLLFNELAKPLVCNLNQSKLERNLVATSFQVQTSDIYTKNL